MRDLERPAGCDGNIPPSHPQANGCKMRLGKETPDLYTSGFQGRSGIPPNVDAIIRKGLVFMKFSRTLQAGMIVGVLAFGLCSHAAVEQPATNSVVATAAVTNQPVNHVATNQVPIPAAHKAVPVEPIPLAVGEEPSWMDRLPAGVEEGDEWWRNRVEIGTRITTYTLTDKSRPDNNHYLGSINRLKEDQDYTPTKVFANVWPLKWVGAGISYEKISAVTWTEEPGETSYSDGTFVAKGPILSLLAAYPNGTRFTPFAEAGMMLISGSFDANPAWSQGDYQDMKVTGTKDGTVLGLGCAIQLGKRVEMDLIYRQIKAALVVDHVLNGSVRASDREFPLDSTWMGAGIKYRF